MFNANHRQHLLVALRELDESLGDIRSCLANAAGTRLFPRYAGRVDAALRARADAAISDARAVMARFLADQQLHAPPPAVRARRAASARASSAMVAALELDPRHVRGYGELSAEESAALEALSAELSGCLAQLVALLDTAPHAAPGSALDAGTD